MINIIVLIFGFAKAAHILYGPYLQPFMTFWSSMREMLAFMIDGYDYQLLARVAPRDGPEPPPPRRFRDRSMYDLPRPPPQAG